MMCVRLSHLGRTVSLYLVLVGISGMGCADVDGKDPYGLFDTYTQVDGLYAFRYLSPPWRFVESESDDEIQLFAIEPLLEKVDTRIVEGAINARVKMVVKIVASELSLQAEAEQLCTGAEAQVDKVQAFYSTNGADGFETGCFINDRYVRAVFYTLGNSSGVAMYLVSRYKLDDADMTLLLKSLEPGRGNG